MPAAYQALTLEQQLLAVATCFLATAAIRLARPEPAAGEYRRVSAKLSRQVEVHRDESVQPGLQIDAEVRLDELSLSLATRLAQLAPSAPATPRRSS